MEQNQADNNKPFSGHFLNWILLTRHDECHLKRDFNIGDMGSTTICIGVLRADARNRFETYRPIKTSAIVRIDRASNEISTMNSRYILIGTGKEEQVALDQFEEALSKHSRQTSEKARQYRRHLKIQ